MKRAIGIALLLAAALGVYAWTDYNRHHPPKYGFWHDNDDSQPAGHCCQGEDALKPMKPTLTPEMRYKATHEAEYQECMMDGIMVDLSRKANDDEGLRKWSALQATNCKHFK
jgi:hypothetical protein